jgi:hypothetical protein
MRWRVERANLGRVLLAAMGTATLLMVVAAAVPEGKAKMRRGPHPVRVVLARNPH